MKIGIVLILLLTLSFAQDIREKVGNVVNARVASEIIDPNDSIFGLELGISEDELLKVRGKAMGYVRLNDKNTALFFDDQISYLFTDGKLSGVTVGMFLIDPDVVNYFSEDLDEEERVDWILDNGIQKDMTLEKVKKILGDRLKKKEPSPMESRQFYEDGDSEVHLAFYSKTATENRGYFVGAVMVVPKEKSR